jgi:hypothetical protein
VPGVVLLAMRVSSADGDQSRCRISGAGGMAILQGNGVRAFLEVIHRGMQVFEMASGRKEELAEVEKDKEKVRCGEEEKRPARSLSPLWQCSPMAFPNAPSTLGTCYPKPALCVAIEHIAKLPSLFPPPGIAG